MTFRKLDLLPSSGEGGRRHLVLGPLDRANLNHWTSFRNVVILDFRTMDKVVRTFQNCSLRFGGTCFLYFPPSSRGKHFSPKRWYLLSLTQENSVDLHSFGGGLLVKHEKVGFAQRKTLPRSVRSSFFWDITLRRVINNYRTTPCNTTEERRSHQHRGESLKSRLPRSTADSAVSYYIYHTILRHNRQRLYSCLCYRQLI
jgi:hypothetical protein